MPDKAKRTALHKTIRELFGGKLESEAMDAQSEEGARIVIKWNHHTSRSGRSSDKRKHALTFHYVRLIT